MKNLVVNWKTTASGIALLLLACLHSLAGIELPGIPMPSLDPATIAIIAGLLMAKDGNVTGAGATARAASIALILGLGLLASPAAAADLPLKALPGGAAIVPVWTGAYVGVAAGGASGSSSVAGAAFRPDGYLAGGTLGYNVQSDRIVYGLEADATYANVSGGAPCMSGAVACTMTARMVSSVRARVGIVGGGPANLLPATLAGYPASPDAPQSTLYYLTAGLPIDWFKSAVNGAAVENATKGGWMVGAGLESWITTAMTAKLELRYGDTGNERRGVTGLVGLNYHFAAR